MSNDHLHFPNITYFLKVVAVVVVAGSDNGCQTHRVEFRR
jgi:hypothetical protein